MQDSALTKKGKLKRKQQGFEHELPAIPNTRTVLLQMELITSFSIKWCDLTIGVKISTIAKFWINQIPSAICISCYTISSLSPFDKIAAHTIKQEKPKFS
jgi:hypothetical protein